MNTPFAYVLGGLLFCAGWPSAFAQSNHGLPPIASVNYDQHGGFRVNGKPFFPVSLYDAPLDETTLAELREFGFNLLACEPKVCGALPAKGFYGAVHAIKKVEDLSGVFLAVGYDSPALYLKKNLLREVAEANAKLSVLVPGRPVMNAIGYWEDEPAGVVKGKLPSKEKYDDLVRAIDVSAPYLYPIPYQPVASVGDAVARARLASGGKKPVLAVLQLFVWEAKDRYPTPAELRSMGFLALVEGATGIGYYSYSSVTGRPKTTIAKAQPDLWKSVKKLNEEIAKIGPKLVGAEPSTAVSLTRGSPEVRMKVVKDSGNILVVLVNSCAKTLQAQLNFKNGKGDDSATVRIEPFGVEVRYLPESKSK